MPFVDRSTLTYPATNSFPIRKWLDPLRNPTSNDYRNFQVFDIWINDNNDTAWIMVDKTATSGRWLNMATSGTGILTVTGTSGGAVGPDGASNLFLLGGTNVTVAGNAGANTLTVTLGGAIASSFPTMAGTATPAAGALTITGSGGITTSGAGSTVTITGGPTIPTTFTENAGSATPSANNLNILGAGGITTSAAGSTITITSTGGGLAWIEVTVVGPTGMAVNTGYVANNGAAVGLLLPLTAAFGSILRIVGKGAGGWVISQNAGQTILLGAAATTVGVAGTAASSESSACLELLCITVDTTWRVIDSTGNIILT